jgi:hypothetical protein
VKGRVNMSLQGNAEGTALKGKINKLTELHGYSAYEIAVINGFSGTAEEWLESLKGEKGDDGEDYVLTEGDKDEIVDAVIEQIPPAEDGISDVLINGATVVDENGVATIPVVEAAKGGVGLVRLGNLSNGTMGVKNINGNMCLAYPEVGKAGLTARKNQGSYQSGVVTSTNFDLAVKVAMTDGVGAEWTEEEQAAARERMGAVSMAEVLEAIQQAIGGGDQPYEPTDQTEFAGAYTSDGTFSNMEYTWDDMRTMSYQEASFGTGEVQAWYLDVVVPDTEVDDVSCFCCRNIVLPKNTSVMPAFANLSGEDLYAVENIYVKAIEPPYIDPWALFEIADVTILEEDSSGGYYENQGGGGGTLGDIIVPYGCGDAYRNAENWCLYSAYITEGEMPTW